MTQELIALLHKIDGHLGLAVYRGEGGSIRWKKESEELIISIRRIIAAETGQTAKMPPGPYRPNPVVPERRGGSSCIGIMGILFGHSPMQVVDQDGHGRGTICRRCMQKEMVR